MDEEVLEGELGALGRLLGHEPECERLIHLTRVRRRCYGRPVCIRSQPREVSTSDPLKADSHSVGEVRWPALKPRSARGWAASEITAVYRRPMDRMPEPGDLIAAFRPQPGRCFRMVFSSATGDTLSRRAGVEGRLVGPGGPELVCGVLSGARPEGQD